MVTSPVNIYAYNSRNLWITYSIAIGLSLITTIIGCLSVPANGIGYTKSFSAIVETTRDPALNGLKSSAFSRSYSPLSTDFKTPVQRLKLERLKSTDGTGLQGGLADEMGFRVEGMGEKKA